MEDYERTQMIVRVILSIILLGLLIFISKKLNKQNQCISTDEPAIAGSDVLEGGAKNPEQFDELDDEALDMMGELLGENEED